MAGRVTQICEEAIPAPDGVEIVHKNPILFPTSLASALIVGASGTGKSHLLLQLVPGLTDKIKTVLIASVVKNNPIHRAILEWANKRDMNTGLFDDPDSLLSALEELLHNKQLSLKSKNALIIFDDFTSASCPTKYAACIDHVVSTYRNSGCHFILITQSPKSLSTICRNNIGTVISFALGNKWSRLVNEADMVVPDSPNHRSMMEDLDEWTEIPYGWSFHTKRPLRYGCGIGGRMSVLADRDSVVVPDVRETMAQLCVSNKRELMQKSAKMQQRAGNDSSTVAKLANL